ncbi:MAG: substrate-binding domain-containing protein [Magnetospirillum sp.]|nr:substrate-binding domain-containing protein [Magnetospirillum sp.]
MRFIMFAALLLAGACVPAWAENLRVGGTGAGLELSRGVAADFVREHGGTQLWMADSLGSSGGIKALAAGRLDVAISMRPLKDGEVAGGASVALCRTPWVFFSHARRADVALRRQDLLSLFAARLPPFPQGEVRALLRPANESGFQYLESTFPELKPAIESARSNRGAVEVVTDQEALGAVEQGLSLVGFGALAPIVAERRKLHVVSLDGVDPTTLPADYPHWSILYLLVGPASSAQGRAFVDYAVSDKAAARLRANGCLPVGR